VKIVFEGVSGPMKVASVVLVVIEMYVLMFSGLSLLYRIGITVFIFALLFLVSMAFQTLEEIQKPEH
jgi:hypothetical protein